MEKWSVRAEKDLECDWKKLFHSSGGETTIWLIAEQQFERPEVL